ncbi:PIG-L deacetylase family protein [Nocardia pseudobrasiliensis]|uniref:GlcNAc-PI de-N-acetylase n=1 Tax=Nocardia pseudobrasiliensis TaxID=45979 RepID=A0A370I167_9NOCA|nr:PIG-L family deacetylase [Nocardia pseudobrasiliensis]RDI64466.1 GlcNAc-PI de-N-acetylase [Nocardia pseudobrasiliensis]
MAGPSEVADTIGAADRLVVVSPHFDDAVLAVGALIAARVQSGQPVEVLTVFTGARDDARHSGRREAFADYVVRRAEDDRALKVLGAQTQRLGLFERIFREPPPIGPLGSFHTPVDIAACPEVAAVRGTLEETLASDAIVLAPLGIGRQIDHVLVAVAALGLAPAPGLLFYEDFAALSERCRRSHPVSRLRPFEFRDSPGWAGPGPCCRMAAMSLLVGGPDPAAALGLQIHPAHWTMTALPTSPPHEEIQLRALAEYRTHLTTLGGARRLRALIHRSHTRRGGDLIWQYHP